MRFGQLACAERRRQRRKEEEETRWAAASGALVGQLTDDLRKTRGAPNSRAPNSRAAAEHPSLPSPGRHGTSVSILDLSAGHVLTHATMHATPTGRSTLTVTARVAVGEWKTKTEISESVTTALT